MMDIVEIFIIVEIVQSMIIILQFYFTNKMVKSLFDDPTVAGAVASNAVQGFMADLYIDEKSMSKKEIEIADIKQKHFFGFMSVIADHMFESLKSKFSSGGTIAAGGQDVPIELLPKKWRGPIALAKMLGIDLSGFNKPKGPAAATGEKVAETTDKLFG